MVEDTQNLREAWKKHDRHWRENSYVYAVVSRRSHGVSVGINLNPDKACNFDCVYCQVDRTVPPVIRRVDLETVAMELERVLQAERESSLYQEPPFDLLRPDQRGVRDIAFSGDGEPTTFPRFSEAVQIVADARSRFGLDATKLVLLTDAAYLRRPEVRAGLEILDKHNGEIWAKLDAGTEDYFRTVDRPNVTLQTVLDNILHTARDRPVVIQSLWMRLHDKPPPESEISAYCERLEFILASGGRLKLIQIYSIARRPSEHYVSPLTLSELGAIARTVCSRVPVPVESFGP